jgi:hypothetical protein
MRRKFSLWEVSRRATKKHPTPLWWQRWKRFSHQNLPPILLMPPSHPPSNDKIPLLPKAPGGVPTPRVGEGRDDLGVDPQTTTPIKVNPNLTHSPNKCTMHFLCPPNNMPGTFPCNKCKCHKCQTTTHNFLPSLPPQDLPLPMSNHGKGGGREVRDPHHPPKVKACREKGKRDMPLPTWGGGMHLGRANADFATRHKGMRNTVISHVHTIPKMRVRDKQGGGVIHQPPPPTHRAGQHPP